MEWSVPSIFFKTISGTKLWARPICRRLTIWIALEIYPEIGSFEDWTSCLAKALELNILKFEHVQLFASPWVTTNKGTVSFAISLNTYSYFHLFAKQINTAPISTLLFANMQCALLEEPQKNQTIFHCFVLFMKWKWELWDEVPNSSPSSIHLPCKNVALVPGSFLLHLMIEVIEGFIPTREWNTRTIVADSKNGCHYGRAN